MGKSARVLGLEFGKTARAMNALLKEHGYLYGEPGAYGLTDKGAQYAEEQYHSRGTGGYSSYNRSWETRTWNEETAEALAADMRAGRASPRLDVPAVEQHDDSLGDEVRDLEYDEDFGDRASDDDYSDPPGWKHYAAALALLAIAPHVKPFWNNRVRPAVRDLRDKRTKQERIEAQTPEGAERPQSATGFPESDEESRSTLGDDTDLGEPDRP